MTDCCDKPSNTCAIPPTAPAPAGAARFRIPAMDCASEEADIRRALESVTGIRSLGFQLVARTLTIDASGEALQAAVQAIAKAGYKMQPLAAAASADGVHENNDHDGVPAGLPRLLAALALAGVAEAISFLAP
ncbi:MAG: heavy metal-associated domain-containing protein, partial [Polaromonas sp.]